MAALVTLRMIVARLAVQDGDSKPFHMQILILAVLLCAPYGVSICLGKTSPDIARLGLGLMLTYTAIGHFIKTGAMMQMIPPFIPWRRGITIISGFLEFGLAAAVVLLPWHEAMGWMLIVFFLAIFPLNVYAAIHRIPFGGSEAGPRYLLLRTPLQLLFLGWTLYFCILHP